MSSPDVCPNGCDLRGGEIPAESRELYGGSTHFSRVTGMYDRGLDRTVAWLCPDCGVSWGRGRPRTIAEAAAEDAAAAGGV